MHDAARRAASRSAPAALLLQHRYPGNIRELENIVEHAVALCDGDTATEEHLPLYLTGEHAPCALPALHSSEPIALPSMLATRRPAAGRRRRAIRRGGSVDLEARSRRVREGYSLRALDQAGGVEEAGGRAARYQLTDHSAIGCRSTALSDAYDDQAIASWRSARQKTRAPVTRIVTGRPHGVRHRVRHSAGQRHRGWHCDWYTPCSGVRSRKS